MGPLPLLYPEPTLALCGPVRGPEFLTRLVGARYGVPRTALLSHRQSSAPARRHLMALLVTHAGLNQSEVGRLIGVTAGGVSKGLKTWGRGH